MFSVDEDLSHLFIDQVERIIRDRWRIIKRTTRYGWLTAYYQSSSSIVENAESLQNIANKIGSNNCQVVIERIREMSQNVHPTEIPLIAETLLSEMYSMVLLQKRQRGEKWSAKIQDSQPSTVFTISNDIF